MRRTCLALTLTAALATACAVDERCEVPPEPGRCRAAIRMYAYDAKQDRCVEFIWGGCGEEAFDSMSACREACE